MPEGLSHDKNEPNNEVLPATPGAGRRVRILVVDDYSAVRQGIVSLVSRQPGYVVCGEAADGMQAVAMAKELRPELVLMDITMPRMNGLEATKAIRDALPGTKVIIVSQNDPMVVREQAAQSGADGWVGKAEVAQDLLNVIERVMGKAKDTWKRDESEAWQHRNRLNLVAQATQVGFWFCDLPFDKLIWDDRVKEHFWLPPDAEVTIDTFYQRLHPDDRERTRQAIARSNIEDSPYDIEYRTVSPDGRIKWIRALGRTFYDPSGRPKRFDGLTMDVTEQKHTEDATAWLAAIVSSSDDAIVSKNLQGIITSWNQSAERMFGYSAEEAVGRHITLIIPHERLAEEIDILARIGRGEGVDHFETVRVRKDGSSIDLSLTISPIKDKDGRVIGASKVARDISEQKRAERRLRESEQRFREIVETTPDCVKLVAQDGTLIHMNTPGLAMIGAPSAESAIGTNVFNLIAPEDRERFRAFHERVCAGEKASLEFDIVQLEGKRRHMESHAAPLLNSDGRIVHLAVTRDVSGRKAAEERERKITADAIAATAKFRAVFEQTTVFAGIMTKDGLVAEANKLCLEACGYRADEVIGRPFWACGWWRNHPESQEKIRTASPLAAQGVPYRETLHYSWADGTERLVDFALFPIVDDAGNVLFLHPTGVDITDITRAQENYRNLLESLDAEVRARTQELEERNQDVLRQSEQLRELSRRLMLAQDEERRHIARELHDSAGQTLTVLGMSIGQLALNAAKNSPDLANEVKAAQELVQQLHQEVRTASYLLHPPLLDKNGLSPALRWYVQGLQERSGLEIELEIPDDFGRLPGEMELVVFRLIQECLTNIHRHSASKTARIRVERRVTGIKVSIEDHGTGIPAENLAEIRAGRTGVGIRGMKERLRSFEGTLDIDSNGGGTRVLVTIPLPSLPTQEEFEVEPVRNVT